MLGCKGKAIIVFLNTTYQKSFAKCELLRRRLVGVRQDCLVSRGKLETQVQAEARENDREMVGTREGERSPSPGIQSDSLASSEARSSCSTVSLQVEDATTHPCMTLVASASRHPSFASFIKEEREKKGFPFEMQLESP